jgi:phosphate starvation-inducible PhoH-like protein|tara:strand:- start:6391 stop:7065 length:675 start_codon:yes stop_codon:yes gene_type:complete
MRKKSHSQNRSKKNSPEKVKIVQGKTENQDSYIRAIIENDVIFCTGPSGSGKSFIPSGIAAQKLHSGQTENVIVTRPLVCSGKEIGSLPGELNEKIAPYLLPMKENIKFFLGRAYYGQYENENRIKYLPLEVMRGSTFNDSYMILDEAQNCSMDQIKMFITRMGKNSKVIINGDVRQTDIRSVSGLYECIDRLKDVEGVAVCSLTNQDIQRNGIIGRILNALEN